MQNTIGFIGAGQMARALASGFVDSGMVEPASIRASDPSAAARDSFSASVPGAQTCQNASAVLSDSQAVFLAVKPQHVDDVFDEVANVEKSDQLFVSIVAGVTLDRLARGLRTGRVVRVMPNTPCLVGAGAAGLSLGPHATDEDGSFVGKLLSAVGMALPLPETLLDAVTGLSGSGPAFVYQIIEALSDGGVSVGLPRTVATKLAAQTVLGAAKMVLETDQHPGALKDQVASPGGTTIAGLVALESGGLRATLIDAVQKATHRSQELGT